MPDKRRKKSKQTKAKNIPQTTVDSSNGDTVTAVVIESPIMKEPVNNNIVAEAVTEIKEHPASIQTPDRIHKILTMLINNWNLSLEEMEIVKQRIETPRSMQLVINRKSDKPFAFSALLTAGKVAPYESPDNNYTTTCTMNEDTFLDILLGKDKHGRDFNVNYAWSCGEIVFSGTDWFVHQAVLKEMFEHFKHLLKLRRSR